MGQYLKEGRNHVVGSCHLRRDLDRPYRAFFSLRRVGAKRCTYVNPKTNKRCENSVKSGNADRCHVVKHVRPVQTKLFN